VGTYRFLEKVWRLKSKIQNPNGKSNPKSKIQNSIHKTIKKVTEDIENLRFNTAISALMILSNEMEHANSATTNAPMRIEDYETLLILLSPFAPFIAEELWHELGHKESIFTEKWPEYDPEMIKDQEIELVIQVNGKVRDKMIVSADISEDDAKKLALESEKIKTFVEGKEIKKIIFVRGRLISIVI
jgi:leucyl-tRNA synthetase